MPTSKYEISVLVGLIDKLSGPARNLGSSLKNLQASMKSTGQSMRSLGSSMTMGITLPIVGFTTMALKASADLEMLRNSFNVLTGDVEKGGKLYEDIVNFAAKTPFQIKGLSTATATLLQYGIELDNVIPTMRTIGDVALGDAEKFKLLSYAYGQIKGATILQGQELRQLINAGFNPLAEISRKTGKSMKQLKADMSKGLITFEMVRDAFKSATSEGGRFYQGMIKGSQTLAGRFSTLKDNIQLALKDIGDALVATFNVKGIVIELTAWVRKAALAFKEFSKNNPKLVKFVGILVMILALIGPLLTAVGFLLIGLGSLGAVPIIAGILAVAAALGLVADNSRVANGEVKTLLGSLMSGDWNTALAIFNDLDTQFGEWAKTSDSLFGSITRGFHYILVEIPDMINEWLSDTMSGLIDSFSKLASIASKFVIGTPNLPAPGVVGSKSETDINLKVKTDSGATVIVEGVKKKKGSSRVNIASKGTTGITTPAGAIL